MKNCADLLRRTGALLAGLAVAASGFAFTFILNDNTGIPIKWPAGTVTLRLMLGTTQNLSDGTSFNGSAQAAVDLWNARMGSLQLQGSQVAAGTAGNHNGVNDLAFSDDVYGKAFDENVLAVTTGYSAGNERTESDTLFNKAKNWDSYRGPMQTKIDLRRVALHEIGHILGLDHPDEAKPVQSVTAIMNSRIGTLDTLADDDIQGIQSLYGPPNIPPNDSFANASVIDLPSGALTISGYNTRATKETGEPNHAGNVGGRSVWYRWKANGSGSVILDTRGSYFDTTLAVYTGTAVNTLTEIASDDDITDGVVQASTVTFNATAGVIYYIAVDGFNGIANDPTDRSGADNAAFKLNLNLTGSVLVAPTITTQPASVTVTSGQNATFTVVATGSEPISFQWLLNGNPIISATSASYTVTNATTLNAGKYSVKVSNPQGTVTSSEATLTVQAAAPPPPPPPSGGGGGGGGGGAPSLWFVTVLLALGAGRQLTRRSP